MSSAGAEPGTTLPVSNELIISGEVHPDPQDVAVSAYNSGATLPRRHHNISASLEAEDKTSLPSVGFIDPGSLPPPVAPGRPVGEDEIVVAGVAVATQTEEEGEGEQPPCRPCGGEEPQEPQPQGLLPRKLQEQEEPPHQDCGILCLYYMLQCCDCVIM